MINNKNAPKGLGALLNKNDTIIAILLTLIIAFLWFETTKFERPQNVVVCTNDKNTHK